MREDEVRVHGVTVGRVELRNTKRIEDGRVSLSFSVGFKPDHVGILHAYSRSLDKGDAK